MVGGEESLQNNTPRVEFKSLGLGKTHFDIDTEYMEDILTFFNQ